MVRAAGSAGSCQLVVQVVLQLVMQFIISSAVSSAVSRAVRSAVSIAVSSAVSCALLSALYRWRFFERQVRTRNSLGEVLAEPVTPRQGPGPGAPSRLR